MTRSRASSADVGSASLVVQTSFLGDTVLTTSLLSELASRGPVDVVTRPDAAALLVGHPAVRDVIVFDKRGADRGVLGLRRLVRRLRIDTNGAPRRYAAAYLVQGSLRSALIPHLLGVRARIGWRSSIAGRWLYTARVDPGTGLHFAEKCWRLAFTAASAPKGAMPRPSLAPGSADTQHARDLLAAAFSPHDVRPLVVLAPGSVWATKRWSGFDALLALMYSDYRVALIGGPSELPLARALIGERAGVFNAIGALSLLGSAALLQHAAALVTNDSVALHLASAMDTPTVAIFGPTVPAFGFGPLASHARVVQLDGLPCRPCHPHGPQVCPRAHFRCMRDLHAPVVYDAMLDVIADSRIVRNR